MSPANTILCKTVCWTLLALTGSAIADDLPHPDADSRGRSTAVTLNYCRASFHRIRRHQSKRVLIEEQDKILNYVKLDSIGDEEVIKLYSSVLDEISKVQIADRETASMHERYRKTLFRQTGATAFAMGSHMALGSVDGAVRSGVNSWLDYRDLQWSREFDVWKVEKERMQAVVEKSSHFLDTFWKLAQKKNIPDHWLVRGNNLDKLEEAVREPDPEKRLRILRREEHFMECYPPYWYYVGRAAQARGDFELASTSYERVADLAHGHFREDDMLTAALANRAIIQEHRRQEGADKTAREALRHSSAVWEANILCAQVLEKHGHAKEAEDAILRNLDVDLEKPNSALALLGFYYRADRLDGLAQMLATDSLLAVLPVPSVLQCLEKLGTDRVPPVLLQRLRESLVVSIEPRFGADDVSVVCDATWLPQSSKVRLHVLNAEGSQQTVENGSLIATPTADPEKKSTEKPGTEKPAAPSNEFVIKFKSAVEAGHLLNASNSVLLGSLLTYQMNHAAPGTPPVIVVLGNGTSKRASKLGSWSLSASPAELRYGGLTLKLTSEPTVSPARPSDSLVEKRPEPTSPKPVTEVRDLKVPRARILDIVALPPAAVVEPQPVPQPQPTPPAPEKPLTPGPPPEVLPPAP